MYIDHWSTDRASIHRLAIEAVMVDETSSETLYIDN